VTDPEPFYLYCATDGCPEYGLPKSAPPPYADEFVHCGACGQPVGIEPPPEESEPS
jgi:hypothetical protein